MPHLTLPPDFTARIAAVYPNGAEWLDQLPALLEECVVRFSLTLGAPFPLSFNYVTRALRPDGGQVVLKLGPPNRELSSEMAALAHWAGSGAPHLFYANQEAGVLIEELLWPGATLFDLFATGEIDDETATRRCAEVMQALWRPAPPDNNLLITVDSWMAGLADLRRHFAGGTGPFPRRLVQMAEELYHSLQSSAAPPVILHGDLHHGNILYCAGDSHPQNRPGRNAGWLAIDPKGVIGEPAYEAGAWLRNPQPALSQTRSLKTLLARRVAIFAEMLALDPQRLLGWGMAQAVLSAWWDLEDTGNLGFGPTLEVAEALADLLSANPASSVG
jgi:streptomycin 6-kinase